MTGSEIEGSEVREDPRGGRPMKDPETRVAVAVGAAGDQEAASAIRRLD